MYGNKVAVGEWCCYNEKIKEGLYKVSQFKMTETPPNNLLFWLKYSHNHFGQVNENLTLDMVEIIDCYKEHYQHIQEYVDAINSLGQLIYDENQYKAVEVYIQRDSTDKIECFIGKAILNIFECLKSTEGSDAKDCEGAFSLWLQMAKDRIEFL